MINAIGDTIVEQTTRASFSSTVSAREVAVQEEMQADPKRLVEKTDASQRFGRQPSDEEKAETTTRQRFEEGKIILEKYDHRGILVKAIPPGYVPLNKIA